MSTRVKKGFVTDRAHKITRRQLVEAQKEIERLEEAVAAEANTASELKDMLARKTERCDIAEERAKALEEKTRKMEVRISGLKGRLQRALGYIDALTEEARRQDYHEAQPKRAPQRGPRQDEIAVVVSDYNHADYQQRPEPTEAWEVD